MRKRRVRFVALMLLTLSLFSATAPAQRRRTAMPGRARAPLLVPLTPEQKEAVTGLIKQAEEVDYDYKFRRQKDLWTKASGVKDQTVRVAEMLPDGNLKKLVFSTGHAYHDAAVMWCAYTDQLGYFTREDVMRVIERLDLRNASPYEMVVITFGAAGMMKDALGGALAKSPTVQARSGPLVPASAKTDWAFPKEGMRSRYNETIKGMIYDLGDGIYAGHFKPDTNRGTLYIVLVILSVPIPRNEISDGDLALVVASKVTNLPERVSDTVLGRSDIGEHRFRTTGGKVVGVTIPPDRKTAIARFIEGHN